MLDARCYLVIPSPWVATTSPREHSQAPMKSWSAKFDDSLMDIGHWTSFWRCTKYIYFIETSYISHHILQPPVTVIDLDTDQLPSFKLEIEDNLLCPVRIQSVVDCFRPLDL